MVNQTQTNRYSRDVVILLIVLLAAFIHGMIYVFIMPPWQHYDEPKHFEYAWLIVKHHGLPKPGDNDPGLSKQVVESMIANDFYRNIGGIPDIHQPNLQIPGYSQLYDKPLYYLLASLPLHILHNKSIEIQLYGARIISLGLLLLTILCAWGFTREVTSQNSILRWMLPLTIALIPAFTDLMTAVNNDTAAVAFFSLFLWGSVRVLRMGVSIINLTMVILSSLACFYTKENVYVAVPLLFILLIILFLRKFKPWLILSIIGFVVFVIFFVIFDFKYPHLWYFDSLQNDMPRHSNASAPLGEYVFQINLTPLHKRDKISQLIPVNDVKKLRGRMVSLGGYIWSSKTTRIDSPKLVLGPSGIEYSFPIEVTNKPEFFIHSFEIDPDARRAWIDLDPGLGSEELPVTVYYDGLILVDGEYHGNLIPVFYSISGADGIFGDQEFNNIIRNASAEKSGINIRPEINSFFANYLTDKGWNRASLGFHTLIDIPSTHLYYRGVFINIFRTFWAKFGWGHVVLLGNKPYRMLAYMCLICLPGIVIGVIIHRRKYKYDVLLYLLVVLVFVYGIGVLRGSNYILYPRLFLASARYIYPVVIPTMLILCYGWAQILTLSHKYLVKKESIHNLIFIFLWIGLDVYSIISIMNYYY